MNSMLDNARVLSGIAHTATGLTAVNGDVIDTAGYRGVLFICKFTTAAANNTIKVQQGAASDMSDAADLEGSSVTAGASDEIVCCEVLLPQERYLRMVALRGTSTVIEWGVAIPFEPRRFPVTNAAAGTLAAESHASPDEGAA